MTSKLFYFFPYLFVFSGALKSNFLVAPFNEIFDVGILLGSITLLLICITVFNNAKIVLSKEIHLFLFSFVLFYLFCLASFSMTYVENPDALKKALQFFTSVPIYILAAIFIYNSEIALKYFWKFGLGFGLFITLSKAFEFITGLVSFQGTIDGYQWITMVSLLGIISCFKLLGDAQSSKHKVALCCALLPLGFGLFIGGARQDILALIFIACFIFYKKYTHIVTLKGIIILLRLPVFLVALIYIGGQGYNIIGIEIRGIERIAAFLGELGSLDFAKIIVSSGRSVYYMDGLNIFNQHFITGVGFGNYSSYAVADNVSHPHNFIIEVLAELGIVGGILISPLIFLLFFKLYSSNYRHRDRVYFIALTFGFFITMMISGDLGTSRIFWFFYVLTLCEWRQSIRADKITEIQHKMY